MLQRELPVAALERACLGWLGGGLPAVPKGCPQLSSAGPGEGEAPKALLCSFLPWGSVFSSLPRASRAALSKGEEQGKKKKSKKKQHKKKRKAGLKITPLATVPGNGLS